MFKRVIRLEIHFVRWNPLKGSSWLPTPSDLEKKKAVINMKNQDQMCFKWCIGRAKNMVTIHPERITPDLREQAEDLDWDGCEFPMAVEKIKYFEARNPYYALNSNLKTTNDKSA